MHSGKYRGNWSPYVPRNLILRYSNPGDWVLDQFMGSGTTLVEAKLLNRHAVGVDINPQSVSISETNLQLNYPSTTIDDEHNQPNVGSLEDIVVDLDDEDEDDEDDSGVEYD